MFKKLALLLLSATLCLGLFSSCGSKKAELLTSQNGQVEFSFNAEQCKENVNKLLKTDSLLIGDLNQSESDGIGFDRVDSTLYSSYTYDKDRKGAFSVIADAGEDNRAMVVYNSINSVKRGDEGEAAFKELNRALIRAVLPQVSASKCEQLLSELGEMDESIQVSEEERMKDVTQEVEIDGVKLNLSATVRNNKGEYTFDNMKLYLAPVQKDGK